MTHELFLGQGNQPWFWNLIYAVFFWLFSSYQDKLFSRCRKKGVLYDNHLYHVSGVKEMGGIQNVGQSSSITQLCLILCDPMNCSTPDFPFHHQLPELAQTHVHQVDDAIQPSNPLSSPFPPAFNLYQHRDLFQWVSSSYQVTKILEFQLQHQSFQWTPRTNLI